jgi:phosphoglycolate phosphatase
MKYRFSLIFFDLDGTIADTGIDILNGVNYAMEKVGFEKLSYEKVLSYIGGGARLLIQRCVSLEEGELLERAYQHFFEFYQWHLTDNTRLYPDVEITLAKLNGIIKTIVTNKPESMSKKILEVLGIARYFDKVVGGDTLSTKKPDPAQLLFLINEFGVPREKCLMVGDTQVDIETAKRAKVFSCAASYGYGYGQDLGNADFTIKSFKELWDIVRLSC